MNKELQKYITDRIVVDNETKCWVWQKYKHKFGYGQVGGDSKWYKLHGKQRVHQLSYIAWKGNYPKELLILHSCNNPSCCNPEHLRTGAHKDNMEDKVIAGNSKGEKNPNAKLTSSDVRYIKVLLGTMKGKDIAEMFEVSQDAISDIKTGRRWSNMP